MLETLHLKNVGPAKEMNLEFGSRLNVITGDNGLGKSFVLDCVWFVTNVNWLRRLNIRMQNGEMVRPAKEDNESLIETVFDFPDEKHLQGFSFSPKEQYWQSNQNKVTKISTGETFFPPLATAFNKIVLQVYANGEFGVFDPHRNQMAEGFGFTINEIWDGLDRTQATWGPGEINKKRISNGLIQDTAIWLLEKGQALEQMQAALRELSEDGSEPLMLKEAIRYSLDDTRKIATITTAYGTDAPITLASAGVKRILTLAYMLVWTWQEHLQYAQIRQLEPVKHMVLLIDEIESHLHPKWQQVILKSILNVAKALDPDIQVQIVLTTHSPVVMQSLETIFDPATDAWFDLDLDKGKKEVVLEKREFYPRGSLNNWITSEAFDRPTPYAPEVNLMREEISIALKTNFQNISPEDAAQRNAKYRAVMGDLDPLLGRWQLALEERGWEL
jgi:predicted ATPase